MLDEIESPPFLSREQALRVLRECPDADLSAFEIEAGEAFFAGKSEASLRAPLSAPGQERPDSADVAPARGDVSQGGKHAR